MIFIVRQWLPPRPTRTDTLLPATSRYRAVMEVVAHLDEMNLLQRFRDVHRAAIDHRVVGDHADRITVEAREAGDERPAEFRLELEDRSPVEDQLERKSVV